MAEIKFYKQNTVPASQSPDGIYFVQASQNDPFQLYVVHAGEAFPLQAVSGQNLQQTTEQGNLTSNALLQGTATDYVGLSHNSRVLWRQNNNLVADISPDSAGLKINDFMNNVLFQTRNQSGSQSGAAVNQRLSIQDAVMGDEAVALKQLQGVEENLLGLLNGLYEEGTWNATITGSFAGSYNWPIAQTYIKIGKMVFLRVNFTNGSYMSNLSGIVSITGLPYTPDGNQYIGNFAHSSALSYSQRKTMVYLRTSGSSLRIEAQGDVSASSALSSANLGSTPIIGSIIYRTT